MKSVRKILVNIFQVGLYVLMYGIFIFGFSNHYLGLRFISRTLAIVTTSFTIFSVWMANVYGKVEIGERKTKPLFHTLALSLLVTNVLTFLALRVMTIHDHFGLSKDLLMLMMVYIAQLIMARLLIAVANSFYFKNYVADRTLIVSNNDLHKTKVLNYLDAHQKQYELVDVLETDEIDEISFLDIDKVFLINVDSNLFNKVLQKTYLLDLDLYYTSNFTQVILSKSDTFMVDDVMFFHYKTLRASGFQLLLKRLIDILISLLGLIVASPLMLLIAIMIKIDDRGPVIFSQERLTQNARVFKIYKFRSMKLNSGDKPAKKDDDRITRVGKIIRKIRVDELPQLFNIIKGDMSIVGPRPESVEIAQAILREVPEFSYRLKFKAGLTGTAQISGKYNTGSRDKLLMDLYYIETFSIFNDLRLMFQTLLVFVKKDSTEGFDE